MVRTDDLFAGLPPSLRKELLDCHKEIVRNYVERRWEPAELNGGKLSEVIYTILNGAISGTFLPHASKPANFIEACRQLEQLPSNTSRAGDHSLRILLPRLLAFLYDIRNNRGVGHVGGDVNPNHADAEAVLTNANWALAELIRIFHKVTLNEAQATVDQLVEKRHPLVWKTEEIKRVLDPQMKKSDQTLLLLYSEPSWVAEDTLYAWVEYATLPKFKTRILDVLHEERKIEYQKTNKRALITSLGIRHVEQTMLDK
jgi:hypothetical protein